MTVHYCHAATIRSAPVITVPILPLQLASVRSRPMITTAGLISTARSLRVPRVRRALSVLAAATEHPSPVRAPPHISGTAVLTFPLRAGQCGPILTIRAMHTPLDRPVPLRTHPFHCCKTSPDKPRLSTPRPPLLPLHCHHSPPRLAIETGPGLPLRSCPCCPRSPLNSTTAATYHAPHNRALPVPALLAAPLLPLLIISVLASFYGRETARLFASLK